MGAIFVIRIDCIVQVVTIYVHRNNGLVLNIEKGPHVEAEKSELLRELVSMGRLKTVLESRQEGFHLLGKLAPCFDSLCASESFVIGSEGIRIREHETEDGPSEGPEALVAGEQQGREARAEQRLQDTWVTHDVGLHTLHCRLVGAILIQEEEGRDVVNRGGTSGDHVGVAALDAFVVLLDELQEYARLQSTKHV